MSGGRSVEQEERRVIQKTAIVGMGALGLLYGEKIATARGPEAVSFVMNPQRLERYRSTVIDCNGEKKTFRMESSETAAPAELVILAVKYKGLASALDTMASSVGPETEILSVMNGITSEQKLARRPSEVEMFAGTVIPMAEARGIPVPANRFLYQRIREMEEGDTEDRSAD